MSVADQSHFTTNSAGVDVSKFADVQARYTRAVLRGRDPRSFPRQTELWHHCNTANNRLDRILKGHDFWSVIEDEEQRNRPNVKKETKKAADNAAIGNRQLKLDVVNGVHIDHKNQIQLHYGMNIVIANYNNDYLCVNRWDEIRCKPKSALHPSDRIVFKIVDLADPTNPAGLQYGDPLWLQVIDSSGQYENSWQNSFILAAKLYGPPKMASMQLDLSWGTKTLPSDSASLSGTSAKDHDFMNASSRSLPTVSEYTAESRSKSETNTARSDDDTNADNNSTAGDLSDNHANGSSNMEDGEEGGGGKQGVQAGDEDGDGENTGGGGAHDASSDICGRVYAVRIVETSKRGSEPGAASTDPSAVPDPTDNRGTRYSSKQSMHLGKWVPNSGSRDPEVSKSVTSLSPVYLEQDLYCLATSQNSSYSYWPKLSMDFIDSALSNAAPPRKQSEEEHNSDDEENTNAYRERSRPSTAEAMGTSMMGEAQRQRMHMMQCGEVDNSAHACLRKVVLRGLPYEHLLDRRCVWKFCLVDNPGELRGTVKEQIAQRLMNKAKVVLKQSELLRKGARSHSKFSYQGEKLLGGETFSKTLRALVTQKTLKAETELLQPRREIEENIAQHFDSMLFDEVACPNDIRTRQKQGRSRTAVFNPQSSPSKTSVSALRKPGVISSSSLSSGICGNSSLTGGAGGMDTEEFSLASGSIFTTELPMGGAGGGGMSSSASAHMMGHSKGAGSVLSASGGASVGSYGKAAPHYQHNLQNLLVIPVLPPIASATAPSATTSSSTAAAGGALHYHSSSGAGAVAATPRGAGTSAAAGELSGTRAVKFNAAGPQQQGMYASKSAPHLAGVGSAGKDNSHLSMGSLPLGGINSYETGSDWGEDSVGSAAQIAARTFNHKGHLSLNSYYRAEHADLLPNYSAAHNQHPEAGHPSPPHNSTHHHHHHPGSVAGNSTGSGGGGGSNMNMGMSVGSIQSHNSGHTKASAATARSGHSVLSKDTVAAVNAHATHTSTSLYFPGPLEYGEQLSVGEKFLAMHNVMTTVSRKKESLSTQELMAETPLGLLGQLTGSPNQSLSLGVAGMSMQSGGKPIGRMSLMGSSLNALIAEMDPIAKKVNKLKAEDAMVTKALYHRDRMDQFKRVTDMFNGLIAFGKPTEM